MDVGAQARNAKNAGNTNTDGLTPQQRNERGERPASFLAPRAGVPHAPHHRYVKRKKDNKGGESFDVGMAEQRSQRPSPLDEGTSFSLPRLKPTEKEQ